MSRQRKRQGVVQRAKNQDKSKSRKQGQDALTEYSAPSSSVVSTLTHLFLLLFYVGVNVWAIVVVFNLYRRYKIEYRNNLIKVLLSVTIQNMCIQTGYFALALTSDLIPISKAKANLKAFCSYLFTTGCLPTSTIVVVGFWSISTMNTDYIFSEDTAALVKLLPPMLNHCWHTAVGIAVLLELLLVHHRYPSHPVALTTILMYNFAYIIEVSVFYYFADMLPYPFLRLLGPVRMIGFFLLCFPVLVVFYYVGHMLSYVRWEKAV